MQGISIRGAREHNLKNINIDLPRNQLVVITGLSGSGKSSLAFDTLYAEGQRRYVESLSAYARQFLQLMQKPDVDSIDGLSPAISIEQKTTSKNPRSTVGTVTEIYDYLRLLFARVGVPHSPETGLPIEAQTVSQIVDLVLDFPEQTKLLILAPIVRGRKGEYKKELLNLKKLGFQRFKIDGKMYEADDLPKLKKNIKHKISVVIDRIVIPFSNQKKDIQSRLADSIETALDLGNGLVFVENTVGENLAMFSSKFACPVSGFTIEEIEPRLFSFNSPQGACSQCDGLGVEVVFDEKMIIPNDSLSLREGAILPWSELNQAFKKNPLPNDYYYQLLDGVAQHYKVSTNTPFRDFPEHFKKIILYGSGDDIVPIRYQSSHKTYITKKTFEGVIPNLKRRWMETESEWTRGSLSRFQRECPCKTCNGKRLKSEALCIQINQYNIADVCSLSIGEAQKWFDNLSLSAKHMNIADRILKEIQSRLGFLVNVGLNYLTLSRKAGTLSGGESQRIRLASQIGSGLTGVLYVLDEPSIGLHQRDNDRFLETLKYLKNIGNSVIVVEHDEDAIRSADYIVDMGPAAGKNGGQIVAQGNLEAILYNTESITGQYLSGKKFIDVNKRRCIDQNTKELKIVDAKENNLKNITVRFPLGVLTCITGVSGSGKSSLVIETLYKILARQLNKNGDTPGQYKKIEGIEFVDKVIDINQSPIGRTPRSNPATYIGCFTSIREWFAELPEAKSRGYGSGRFSFNVKGGRCEACQGDGVIKIEMHFLPDVYVTCEHCEGRRYNRETLEITYKNKSIADVLDMTVDEAAIFFDHHPQICNKLKTLQYVGLGYINVGQQATTLSGGEAQRVKLAKELSKRSTGKTVYILDEPTTGLHFEDIKKLLEVLHQLVEQGNTVIVIEHNLEVIKTADWIIDIGPEGGDQGGYIVAEGIPEDIVKCKASYTGKYLKNYLK